MLRCISLNTSGKIGVAMAAVAAALLGLAWAPVHHQMQAVAIRGAVASPRTGAPLSVSAAMVYERVHASVAQIETAKGVGSGAYVGDQLVVTVAHLFPGQKEGELPTGEATVYLNGGQLRTPGRVVGWDRARDVAVVRLDTDPGVPALVVHRAGPSVTGQKAYLVGYPLGLRGRPLVTEGIISRVMEDPSESQPFGHSLEHTIVGPPGTSGSPIFDAYGRLIGIHQAEVMTRYPLGSAQVLAHVGLYRGMTVDGDVILEQPATGDDQASRGQVRWSNKRVACVFGKVTYCSASI